MDIKVIIVEDNDTIRNGLSFIIDATEGMRTLTTFSNVEDYITNLPNFNPDVILMDIGLPGKNGIEGVKETVKIYPNSIILMQTVYEDSEKIFDALCAGASGYLLKKTPPAKMVEAIRDAHSGGSPMSSSIARMVVTNLKNKGFNTKDSDILLTDREKEILQDLTRGNSYKMIADNLNLSIDTIRYHISKIYKKLHVHNQSEAVAIALKKNLV
ncbi:MAG: response regulator transcription factor [Melioribacteraceae bacterium]|nr:response regulator transcription factor [Melioribacteraceae bacterium]